MEGHILWDSQDSPFHVPQQQRQDHSTHIKRRNRADGRTISRANIQTSHITGDTTKRRDGQDVAILVSVVHGKTSKGEDVDSKRQRAEHTSAWFLFLSPEQSCIHSHASFRWTASCHVISYHLSS